MVASGVWIGRIRSLLIAASAAAALAQMSAPARAVQITCIEASKYKYLYRLFDNDRRRFAAYFQVEERNLPGGEVCRAAVIVGSIIRSQDAEKKGERAEVEKLLAMIEQSNGWLATLYLASGGGNISAGLRLAELTRMFWLKTVSPNTKTFTYRPDFIPNTIDGSAPAPGLASGGAEPLKFNLDAYRQFVKPVEQIALTVGRGRCASACTYTHVAGIDRRGVVHVHRGRPGRNKTGDEGSMSDTVQRLQNSEAMIIALYRKMDTSEDFVETFRATPDATVKAVTALRSPRYIGDSLRRKCKAEPGELEEREGKLAETLAKAPADAPNLAAMRTQLATLQAQRAQVEQCAAAAHERERLAQFAKYCAGGRCDRSKALREVSDRVKALQPPKAEKSRR
jgi:hypothetical protein